MTIAGKGEGEGDRCRICAGEVVFALRARERMLGRRDELRATGQVSKSFASTAHRWDLRKTCRKRSSSWTKSPTLDQTYWS